MSLTGDFAKLAALERNVKELGRGGSPSVRAIASAVIKEVRVVLKMQFQSGTGPDGAWKAKKGGKPALVSRKLATTFTGKAVNDGAQFTARVPWLAVHHTGYTYPARKSAGGQVVLQSKKGKFIKEKRAAKGKGARGFKMGAHTVGARVLPARPIFPVRGMPFWWAAAINRGASTAMTKWYSKATV